MTIIYINNKWIEDSNPVISCRDRGFLLGDGIFETIKVVKNNIMFFDEHWQRFSYNSNYLKIKSPTKTELENNIHHLIKLNQLEFKSASVRITLSRGLAERGLKIPSNIEPTCLITAVEYVSNHKNTVSLYISSLRKNEFSPLTKIKSIDRLENILAREEAEHNGYDDALFLNIKGNITETTIANFFIVINKKIVTPPIEEGILPGVMREKVITLAKELGIEISEMPLPKDMLHDATEAFISNVLIGIVPVSQINNINFIDDRPIYKSLIS